MSRELGGNWIVATTTWKVETMKWKVATIIKKVAIMIHYSHHKEIFPIYV
jgi:hypothetical protein